LSQRFMRRGVPITKKRAIMQRRHSRRHAFPVVPRCPSHLKEPHDWVCINVVLCKSAARAMKQCLCHRPAFEHGR
jgi:hypothetical protein